MFDIGSIINLVKTVTTVTPEFMALGHEVAKLLSGKDQAELQNALAEARLRSDGIHARLQDETKTG